MAKHDDDAFAAAAKFSKSATSQLAANLTPLLLWQNSHWR